MDNKRKIIVVLGMHRSGTSVITRALQVMGVDLGDREPECVDAPRPPAEEPVERGPVLGASEVRRDERAGQGTCALGHHPPKHHCHEVLEGGLPREAAAQGG